MKVAQKEFSISNLSFLICHLGKFLFPFEEGNVGADLRVRPGRTHRCVSTTEPIHPLLRGGTDLPPVVEFVAYAFLPTIV